MTKEETRTALDIEYYIKESRYGLYTSYKCENDEPMSTAMTKEACIVATEQIHIPSLAGVFKGFTSQPRSGSMGAKL